MCYVEFHLALSEGKRPYLYTLTEDIGVSYMETIGFDKDDIYFLPEGEIEKSFDEMQHLMELNDFLILIKLFASKSQYVVSVDIEHDKILRKSPVTFLDNDGKRVDLGADGFVVFLLKLSDERVIRVPFWVELDRGTHRSTKFKKKYRDLKEAARKGALKKRFGFDEVFFIYVTTDTKGDRVYDMRMWLREELRECGPYSPANRAFKFIYLPSWKMQTPEWLRDFDVKSLFTANMWSVAYGEDSLRFALLEDIARLIADKRKQERDSGVRGIMDKRVDSVRSEAW